MTNIFRGQISHYHNIEEFQEKAGKTLNSLVHLRNKNKNYDYFDFFTDDAKGEYIAVGYYEGEQPPEVEIGEMAEAPEREYHSEDDLADTRFCLYAQPLYEKVKDRKPAGTSVIL